MSKRKILKITIIICVSLRFLEGRKGDSQETDVHFRSLTGEGNFNWRMVYDLEFILQENKMVQTKKVYD